MVEQDSGTGTGHDGSQRRVPPPRGPLHAVVLRGWRALAGLSALARRHRLATAALTAGVVLRVIVMAGFGPAALFKLDTYDYLWDAAHLQPNPVNPSGYAVFLWLFKPFHSLLLIAGLQHLMGLAIAVMIYAILRSWGAGPWLATAAAAPVLFDPAQLLLEQYVMADILAMLLMMTGFAVLLTRRFPGTARAVTGTLLLGLSAVVRPATLVLIGLVACYLLVRRTGWRTAAAAVAAGLLPIAGYVAWFASVSGNVGLTSSDGLFLWSRTMSFANCAVIKPPADLRDLCPGRQPYSLVHANLATRMLPRQYLWDHRAWLWLPAGTKITARSIIAADRASRVLDGTGRLSAGAHQLLPGGAVRPLQPRTAVPTQAVGLQGAGPGGIVPDTAGFTAANNARARDFAIRAIEAQPLDYARVIVKEFSRAFYHSDQLHFPGTLPPPVQLAPSTSNYMLAAVAAYTGSAAGVTPYLANRTATRLAEPYAGLVSRYQDHVHLPGPLFALIMLAGLAGVIIRRTRTAAGALLWASAVILMVLPVAEHEYTYRYAVPAIPLACLAAALAVRRRPVPARGSEPEPRREPQASAAGSGAGAAGSPAGAAG
jgi:hypothetical protein